MKKTTVSISYDDERLKALRLYLEEKEATLEDELLKAMEQLYTKTVPQAVREYLTRCAGVADPPREERRRRPRPEPNPNPNMEETVHE